MTLLLLLAKWFFSMVVILYKVSFCWVHSLFGTCLFGLSTGLPTALLYWQATQMPFTI